MAGAHSAEKHRQLERPPKRREQTTAEPPASDGRAQREPVTIRRQKRDVAVVLSAEQVVLSAADYARPTRANVDAFDRFCDEVGARAEARGLTEDKLSELLAGDG